MNIPVVWTARALSAYREAVPLQADLQVSLIHAGNGDPQVVLLSLLVYPRSDRRRGYPQNYPRLVCRQDYSLRCSENVLRLLFCDVAAGRIASVTTLATTCCLL